MKTSIPPTTDTTQDLSGSRQDEPGAAAYQHPPRCVLAECDTNDDQAGGLEGWHVGAAHLAKESNIDGWEIHLRRVVAADELPLTGEAAAAPGFDRAIRMDLHHTAFVIEDQRVFLTPGQALLLAEELTRLAVAAHERFWL